LREINIALNSHLKVDFFFWIPLCAIATVELYYLKTYLLKTKWSWKCCEI